MTTVGKTLSTSNVAMLKAEFVETAAGIVDAMSAPFSFRNVIEPCSSICSVRQRLRRVWIGVGVGDGVGRAEGLDRKRRCAARR